MARIFDFKKSYEEVEIAGNTYKIEFTDEKLIQYNKSFDDFYVESNRLSKIDTSEMTTKEKEDLFTEIQSITKKIVEELLGKGTHEELYEASGKSLMNLIEMVEFLSEVVGEKMKRIQASKRKQYVQKKKK